MLRIVGSTKIKKSCSPAQNHPLTPKQKLCLGQETQNTLYILKSLYHKISLSLEKNKNHTNHIPQEIANQIRGAIIIGNACFIILAQKSLFAFALLVCMRKQRSNLFILPRKAPANQTERNYIRVKTKQNKNPTRQKRQKKDIREGRSFLLPQLAESLQHSKETCYFPTSLNYSPTANRN